MLGHPSSESAVIIPGRYIIPGFSRNQQGCHRWMMKVTEWLVVSSRGTDAVLRRFAVMVKVENVSSAGAYSLGRAVIQFVPLGLGWRCDFCGEVAGQERGPAPEQCPRCRGAHFTAMTDWRERCRMRGLSLDHLDCHPPPIRPRSPNPADPLPDPPVPVPDLPPGVPNPPPVR